MRRFLLVFAAVVTAATMAGAASASTNVTVSLTACNLLTGGTATVPADSTVTLRAGWQTTTRGSTQAFLNAVSVTASIDGVPIADADGYWGAPEPITVAPYGDLWVAYWRYPTGITLAAGDSITVAYEWTLSHQVVDATIPGIIPATHYTGPFSYPCTITAS